MSETDKSFWHTVPGVITAVATLITALGGVLAILVQNDVIGGRSPDESNAVVADVPAGEPPPPIASEEKPVQPLEASAGTPWSQSTAALVRRDGTTTTVRAPTVGLACSTGAIEFKNGQRISLERVRSIRFDAIYTENASSDGVVTLLDGQELTDPIHTWNCPVTGANELGSISVKLADIKRVEFNR